MTMLDRSREMTNDAHPTLSATGSKHADAAPTCSGCRHYTGTVVGSCRRGVMLRGYVGDFNNPPSDFGCVHHQPKSDR